MNSVCNSCAHFKTIEVILWQQRKKPKGLERNTPKKRKDKCVQAVVQNMTAFFFFINLKIFKNSGKRLKQDERI